MIEAQVTQPHSSAIACTPPWSPSWAMVGTVAGKEMRKDSTDHRPSLLVLFSMESMLYDVANSIRVDVDIFICKLCVGELCGYTCPRLRHSDIK